MSNTKDKIVTNKIYISHTAKDVSLFKNEDDIFYEILKQHKDDRDFFMKTTQKAGIYDAFGNLESLYKRWWILYSKSGNYILGFHGCTQRVADILLGSDSPTFKKSTNDYDWLGHGMYFWENDPKRAMSFIREQVIRVNSDKNSSKEKKEEYKDITVVGAVIDLAHCLNLTEIASIEKVKKTYYYFVEKSKENNRELPKNRNSKDNHDLLFRNLDCAVIEFLHAIQNSNSNLQPYDTVKGMFKEGEALYEGAGFLDKTHIQICVRNEHSIKGYFIPIKEHKPFEY